MKRLIGFLTGCGAIFVWLAAFFPSAGAAPAPLQPRPTTPAGAAYCLGVPALNLGLCEPKLPALL